MATQCLNLDRRAAQHERLRNQLPHCIESGCLSLDLSALANLRTGLADHGPGALRLDINLVIMARTHAETGINRPDGELASERAGAIIELRTVDSGSQHLGIVGQNGGGSDAV